MRTLENNQELNKQVKQLIEKCQDFENFFKEYQNLKVENVKILLNKKQKIFFNQLKIFRTACKRKNKI